MRFLTEDGSYNISQETRGLILQEFLGVGVNVSHTPSVSANIDTSRSISVSVTHTPSVVVAGGRGIVVSVAISQSQTIVVLKRKARGGAVQITHNPSLSVTQTTNRTTSAQIASRPFISTATAGEKSKSVSINHTPNIDLFIEGIRPEPIVSFKILSSTDSGNTLQWQVGAYTDRVHLYRAGIRGNFVLAKSFPAATTTFVDNIAFDPDESYSYQLIPFGVSNKMGKASPIIYTTRNNIL